MTCTSEVRLVKRNGYLSSFQNVTYVSGNHEGDLYKARLATGLNWLPYYEVVSGGKKFLIQNGHRYDNWVGTCPWLENAADFIYNGIQKLDKSHSLAKGVKHSMKKFIKCIDKVAGGALSAFAGAIYGHTQYAMNIGRYWNCGCWTEKPGTYVSKLETFHV